MLERESLEDIPRRLRLPVQANPSERVDLPDRHIYIFAYEAMPFFCYLLLMPLTVHLILAVAHCSALTSLFLIGSKNYASPLLQNSYRSANLLSHVLTCVQPSHYTLLPIIEVSPRPEASLMATWVPLARYLCRPIEHPKIPYRAFRLRRERSPG